MATTMTLGGNTTNINETIRLDQNKIVKAYGKKGNDTYIITSQQTKNATISDTLGKNVIVLEDGLSITKSMISSTKHILKLSNGASITVLSPSKFIYQIGDSTSQSLSYADFKSLIGTKNYTVQTTKPVEELQSNTEDLAPFVFKTNNPTQLDSITTILTYTPDVQANVNYQNYQPEAWRNRATSSELSMDLTQTTTLSNNLMLSGNLENSDSSERWYKINLAQKGSIQIQDLSPEANRSAVEAVIFQNPESSSLSYFYSNYDASKQLTYYNNLPAGNYYIRVSKEDSVPNTLTSIDYQFAITTHTSDSFALTKLPYQSNQIKATIPANQSKVYYSFNLSNEQSLTVDMSTLASNYEFAIFKQDENGNLQGSTYTYFSNAPKNFIYDLTQGDYVVRITASKTSTKDTQINVPVILDDTTKPLTFNAVTVDAPKILKADTTKVVMPRQYDSDGNLILTYSFDIKPILNTEDAQPSPTVFSEAQKQATREAFKTYENIAKLKFVELPNNSSQKANFYFVNVDNLGGSAGEASNKFSNMNDVYQTVIRISRDTDSNQNVNVGDYGFMTLVHEIGHGLGLKHPQQYENGGESELPYLISNKDNMQYTIMSYNTHSYKDSDDSLVYDNSGTSSAKTPLLYDVSAIQYLYGENTTFNQTDTIYQWASNTDPYMTIWDSKGNDTIDVSNQTFDQFIDLRAGHFSSIGAVTIQYSDNTTEFYASKDNVSIAYETIIENATGSKGNDTIIGNSVANELIGNDGQDQFVFSSKLSATNVDTLPDFNPLEDKIVLDKSIFENIQTDENGMISSDQLLTGNNKSQAETASQHLIIDNTSHKLYYDKDGVGGSAPVAFAMLPNVSELSTIQFLVF